MSEEISYWTADMLIERYGDQAYHQGCRLALEASAMNATPRSKLERDDQSKNIDDRPQLIALESIQPHPDNPRIAVCDEVIDCIRQSIQERGSFDPAHAIKIRPLNGSYQIVSGHNRYAAAQRAGLKDMPAWIREMTDEEAYMCLVLDNAQRELRPLERGMHALSFVKRDRKGEHTKQNIEWYAKEVKRLDEVSNVQREYYAARVADAVKRDFPRGKFEDLLSYHRHLAEIHAAPEVEWPGLVEWLLDSQDKRTVQEVQAQVRAIRAKAKQAEKKRLPETVTLDEWKVMSETERVAIIQQAGAHRGSVGMNEQQNTQIDWAKYSWNPITGCLHNCPYCYARDIAEKIYSQKFQPTLCPTRLGAPYMAPPSLSATDIGWKNIFTCSMADLFGQWVPREWIKLVLQVVRDNPQWNFLFLTKFPLRMAEFEYPKNAWLGTTVDLQARVANAEKAMRNVRASVKWLSIEPLIEPLHFEDISAFQWIVIGGASASTQTPEWRPPRQWVWDLTFEAMTAGCIVYHKDNLPVAPKNFPGQKEALIEPDQAPSPFHYLKEVR